MASQHRSYNVATSYLVNNHPSSQILNIPDVQNETFGRGTPSLTATSDEPSETSKRKKVDYVTTAFPPPKGKIEGFENDQKRLSTFQDWPVEVVVKARDLAHAGLIATGNGDRAKCVFCLGVMYNWDIGDDPLQEHARHFSKCAYIAYLSRVALHTNLDMVMENSESVLTLNFVSENWNNLATVKIVKKLGFADDLILEARVVFLRKQKQLTVSRFFSQELLDVLNELESIKETEAALPMQLKEDAFEPKHEDFKKTQPVVVNQTQGNHSSLPFEPVYGDIPSISQSNSLSVSNRRFQHQQALIVTSRGSVSLKSTIMAQNQPTATRVKETANEDSGFHSMSSVNSRYMDGERDTLSLRSSTTGQRSIYK